jgi:ribosomal protein S18 acetylase RimI-like enzyme
VDPAGDLLRARPEPFDSDQLGAPIARLEIEPRAAALPPAQLDAALGARVDGWRREGLWLVCCRVPAERPALGAALERAGFRRIETLVTLARSLAGPPAASAARPAEPADLAACVEIARSAFEHDRFHADPAIPRERADALKAAWVRNGFLGRADAALVVRTDGRARGFVLCLKRGREASIDLIAVAPDARGRGHGRALVEGALAHYAGSCDRLVVSTQLSDRASLSLYAMVGFEELCRSETYHWTARPPP